MRYVWKCQKCDKEVEVDRRLADRDKPPEGEEVNCCDDPEYKRGLTAGAFNIEGFSYKNGYS